MTNKEHKARLKAATKAVNAAAVAAEKDGFTVDLEVMTREGIFPDGSTSLGTMLYAAVYKPSGGAKRE